MWQEIYVFILLSCTQSDAGGKLWKNEAVCSNTIKLKSNKLLYRMFHFLAMKTLTA